MTDLTTTRGARGGAPAIGDLLAASAGGASRRVDPGVFDRVLRDVRAADRPAAQRPDRPADRPADRADRSAERAADRAADRAAERAADRAEARRALGRDHGAAFEPYDGRSGAQATDQRHRPVQAPTGEGRPGGAGDGSHRGPGSTTDRAGDRVTATDGPDGVGRTAPGAPGPGSGPASGVAGGTDAAGTSGDTGTAVAVGAVGTGPASTSGSETTAGAASTSGAPSTGGTGGAAGTGSAGTGATSGATAATTDVAGDATGGASSDGASTGSPTGAPGSGAVADGTGTSRATASTGATDGDQASAGSATPVPTGSTAAAVAVATGRSGPAPAGAGSVGPRVAGEAGPAQPSTGQQVAGQQATGQSTAGTATGVPSPAQPTTVGGPAPFGVVAGTPAGQAAVPGGAGAIGPFTLQQLEAVAAATRSRLAGAALGDVTRLVLHLNPAELGPVRITAEHTAAGIDIGLAGGDEQTREVLRGALADLRQHVGDGQPRDASGWGGGHGGQPDRRTGGGSPAPAYGPPTVGATTLGSTAEAPVVTREPLTGRRSVDVRA